ncbi:MAG: Trm112 family protein [Hyphomicrobiaceae bacterium]
MAEQDEHGPAQDDGASSRLSARLLEFLVCPVTKTTLEISADKSELISRAARLAYPIRDGIPLLTAETARDLTDEELRK